MVSKRALKFLAVLRGPSLLLPDMSLAVYITDTRAAQACGKDVANALRVPNTASKESADSIQE